MILTRVTGTKRLSIVALVQSIVVFIAVIAVRRVANKAFYTVVVGICQLQHVVAKLLIVTAHQNQYRSRGTTDSLLHKGLLANLILVLQDTMP